MISSELCISSEDTLILRGSRLVIPSSLQDRVLAIAHEGHQGVVRTKQLLREKVWFTGIDDKVEKIVARCIPCQAITTHRKSEPLQRSTLPSKPWSEVSIDFSGPYPTSEYLMVVMDEYSRFPLVEIIKSTSAATVIPRLDHLFSVFGVPDHVKTDNGPPFNGHEFCRFATTIGFKHGKITPLWPKANGEVERFMRTVGKAVKAITANGQHWRKQLPTFLRNYRSTPHPSTGVTPA